MTAATPGDPFTLSADERALVQRVLKERLTATYLPADYENALWDLRTRLEEHEDRHDR